MLSRKQEAGMDILVAVTFVASIFIVGYLAYERGRSQSRWVWTAAAIGPLAIPLLYLVAAASAFRKMINAPGP
jgi:hypothetical protein